jgi:phosphatidylinositol alpha-mannosyltransferase
MGAGWGSRRFQRRYREDPATVSAVEMRIGLVCPYSLSVPGGVQAQVLGMARELRRRGYEARVLGPCDGPPPAGFVTPLGDSLPTAANGSIAPLAPDPAAALRTIRVLYEERFDVLHLHEPLAPGPTVTALTMHPAPVVGTFHAAGESSSYRLLRPALLRLISRIDHKVVVSRDALDLVQRYLGGSYEVAFNGVELDAISAVEPFQSEHRSILFLGRHEQRKGLAVLLEALAQVPADVECWVIGEGPDTAELRARFGADSRIQWLGRVSEQEKLARMRGATLFCAPSLGGESFGVVLVEAMAAGTPVVASALDGYRNVATNGVNSLLLPPGDAVALGRALADLLADPVRQGELRQAGLQRAADFSMSALVDRYVEIYKEIVARQHEVDRVAGASRSRANRIGGWLSRMR